MSLFLRKNPILILTFIAALNLIIAFTYVNNYEPRAIGAPLLTSPDTATYLDAMRFIEGSEPHNAFPTYVHRLLTTPLMLLSSLALEDVFGGKLNGMMALNMLFYFLSVPIVYSIAMHVYRSIRVGYLATFLYITNWGLFSFGTTYVTDMGGWFFFLLGTLCALRYFAQPHIRKWYYAAILSATIGVLFKEYGALSMVSLGFLILLIPSLSWKQKIVDIVRAGVLFLIPLVVYHGWFFAQFGYSYFNWWGINYDIYMDPTSPSEIRTVEIFLKVLGWIFLPGWPLFLLGLWHEGKAWFRGERRRAYTLLALLPASLAFLAWPAFTQRVMFIFIPWLALVTGFGMSKIQSVWLTTFFLLLYAIINYHVHILMLVINI